MLLGTVSVSVSSVKWQKCRQLVLGLGVHSLHLSSGKQGRRFVRNLLQWRWTFLQLQHHDHRPMSRTILSLWIVVFRAQKSYDQITDCESLFEDEYGHFVFTWCSVTDCEKEVNAKCLS